MPTSIPLPNCSVAIRNTGPMTLHRQYAQKNHEFPKGGAITVVSYELAHHFFGFELNPKGQLFRNEIEKYADGQDSAWYSARANFLPWGWSIAKEENEKPSVKVGKDKDGNVLLMSKMEVFEQLKDTWENHIEGRLISFPRELSAEQFNRLPESAQLEPV
jgi:hypothetical protein